MTATQLINTVLKFVLRPLIMAGIDVAARRGKAEADMTPEERDQARKARELARHAEQAARLTRRLRR